MTLTILYTLYTLCALYLQYFTSSLTPTQINNNYLFANWCLMLNIIHTRIHTHTSHIHTILLLFYSAR